MSRRAALPVSGRPPTHTPAGGRGGPPAPLVRVYRTVRSGAHHQLAHQAEVLIAIAFAVRYLHLGPTALKVLFWLTQIGMWTNPIAYITVALTGQGNIFFRNERGEDLPTGFYGQLAFNMLMVCGVCDVIALLVWIVGLVPNLTTSAKAAGAAAESDGGDTAAGGAGAVPERRSSSPASAGTRRRGVASGGGATSGSGK